MPAVYAVPVTIVQIRLSDIIFKLAAVALLALGLRVSMKLKESHQTSSWTFDKFPSSLVCEVLGHHK